MKAGRAIAVLVITLLVGCQFAPHQVDVLHQEMFGIGGWHNYDTRGWLLGIGHVTRATRTPIVDATPNSVGVFGKPRADKTSGLQSTQIDLQCVTNPATQFTILISPGPVVVRGAP